VLPNELMCVEWLKRNRPSAARVSTVSSNPASHGVSVATKPATDLFGEPVMQPAARTARAHDAAKPCAAASLSATLARAPGGLEGAIRDPFRGLTTEDIERFKALGAEVCFRSDAHGEMWLVPEYTSQARREITPEHAATIARVLTVFPDARVVSFNRTNR
jgi:hypothetical protein